MKKLLSLMMALTLYAGLSVPVMASEASVTTKEEIAQVSVMDETLVLFASSASFTDISSNAYYASPVKWAVEKGITTGTTTTTFSPHNTCTNAQILTFLWRSKGCPEPTISNPFTNINTSDYFYKAALWAYENGMVSGTTFNGSAPCTRSQTVLYMWQAAGKPTVTNTVSFTDVPSNAAYTQAVKWAVGKGVTNGTTETTFSPNDTCTRGQIVTFLHRDLAQSKPSTPAPSTPSKEPEGFISTGNPVWDAMKKEIYKDGYSVTEGELKRPGAKLTEDGNVMIPNMAIN